MKELSKEQQILVAMRQTLTTVIREITPPPGMKHPLSERAIEDVRQCLALLAAREKELADAEGRRGDERPYYTDSPPAAQIVPIGKIGKPDKKG